MSETVSHDLNAAAGTAAEAAPRRIMAWLDGLPVLVLGLGDSGLAMARWCLRHGAAVTVWDSREQPPGLAALQAEASEQGPVPLLTGDLRADRARALLGTFKLVLKSPGLAPSDARIAPLLHTAREMGVSLMGELDLFAQALHELRQPAAPAAAAVDEAPSASPAPAAESVAADDTQEDASAIEEVAQGDGLDGTDGEDGEDGSVGAETVEAAAVQEVPEAADNAEAIGERPLPIPLPVKVEVDPTVYAPQVLAITGTNGKTTTTALTAQLVERAGRRVAVAGNIGPTLLDTLAAALALPMAERPEVWVLELSSFQLDGGGFGLQGGDAAFEPTAGVVLNITQDHLDWHGTLAAYSAAKARVYGRDSWMVVNQDDPAVEALVPQPEVIKTKGKTKVKPVTRRIVRYGLQRPSAPGDFGLVDEAGMAWLVRALPPEEGIKLKRGEVHEVVVQRLMPADALRIRGRHNASNALAALALASAIGCPLAPMLHGLREYSGEPHRVQPVALIDGIEAYDDSKGTNVGATVAALTGLGADKAPGRLAVILGGDGKGQDFAPLAAPLARHARAIALIGRDAPALSAMLQAAQAEHPALAEVPTQAFDTLPAATQWCFEQARSGDAVLLSPACASLDMFRNYAHRAEVFVEAVQALAAEKGQLA